MPKFHSLVVKDIRRETADCVSVGFNLPEELKPEYAFTQGQHLTLKTELNGEEVRRSYSICSSPMDGDLRVAVKKLPMGLFSTYVNERLHVGDSLDVMTPMGNFYTPLDPAHQKHYVAFAAGSGITPIVSILKTVLLTEPKSQFTLFFGNRSTDTVIFREQLEDLKNRFLQRLSIHYVFSQEDPGADLFFGRIDEGKCRAFCTRILNQDEIDEFFICGPERMIEAVRQTLTDIGVPKKKVHFELFTSPAGKLGGEAKTWQPPAHPVLSNITITIDGQTFDFAYSSSKETILDAAHQSGADLPYACKGGVCCTCKAKVLEGSVEMEVNYGLEPEEVENNYVLTCQAHPLTEKVVLSFDE
ncbi:MAG: 1,2-phenylacetyl-CoA epoxidase subunit PaaE [Saprospiraceae bacterium]